MKKINFLTLICLLLSTPFLSMAAIEEEFIKPLQFPKFSLTGAYAAQRHFLSVHTPSIQFSLDGRFESAMSFEASLYRYLNAGVIFSSCFSKNQVESEPIDLRFGFFAKPYFPIGSRFSLFARFAGGAALSVAIEKSAAEYYREQNKNQELSTVYREQEYFSWPFGGYGSASFGIEIFPFQRFGIALEAGLRASIFRNNRNIPFTKKRANTIAHAPTAFNFAIYEIPVSLTFHGIF